MSHELNCYIEGVGVDIVSGQHNALKVVGTMKPSPQEVWFSSVTAQLQLFLLTRTFKSYSSQLSNAQPSGTNCGHCVAPYRPMTDLLYNWKFVPFDPLHPFHPPPTPSLWQLPVSSHELNF